MTLAEVPWQVFMTPFGIPIAAIVGVFAWLIIVAISEAVSKVMCNQNNTELKRELLARGFTAQEIIGVIDSGSESGDTASRHPQSRLAPSRNTL
jgi:hypothetical protein